MVPILNALNVQCAVYGNHDFGMNTVSVVLWFLADRTIGRAIGTMCRLSSVCRLFVCRLSVTFCIVAKRYVLAKKCLKE